MKITFYDICMCKVGFIQDGHKLVGQRESFIMRNYTAKNESAICV